MKCPLHKLTMQPFHEEGRTAGIRCPESGCGKGAYLADPGYIPAQGYSPAAPFRPVAAVDPAPEPEPLSLDNPLVVAARRELVRGVAVVPQPSRDGRSLPPTKGDTMACKCGCGARFIPRSGNSKYASTECRERAYAARLDAQRKTSRRTGTSAFMASNQ